MVLKEHIITYKAWDCTCWEPSVGFQHALNKFDHKYPGYSRTLAALGQPAVTAALHRQFHWNHRYPVLQRSRTHLGVMLGRLHAPSRCKCLSWPAGARPCTGPIVAICPSREARPRRVFFPKHVLLQKCTVDSLWWDRILRNE
jgi:hypothetical protein